MFTTIIVQPIFNLLVLIYALLPGHNFGLALILFTIVIRLLLWPLVKRQLHQTKQMRKLQPELKRIQKEAAGDRQKASAMQLELYKERGINPFGAIGPALLQLPILLGLYKGLELIIKNPHQIVSFSYPAIQQLGWLKHLATNIHAFDATLFGLVDLTRAPLRGGVYWPALLIAVGSAFVQFLTTRQIMPHDPEARSVRAILKEAGAGKQADQAEMSAAVSRGTMYIVPAMVLFFTVHLPALLGLYWLTGSLIALVQQHIVLREDVTDLSSVAATKDAARIPEAEGVPVPGRQKTKKAPSKKRKKK